MNFFARAAHTYSGSPWLLWLMVATQTLLALDFLFLPHAMWWRLLGVFCAFVALCYSGALIYFYRHREELAANPAPPIPFGKRELLWTVAIVLALVAIFGVLILTIWRS